jgi:hypothetical protein
MFIFTLIAAGSLRTFFNPPCKTSSDSQAHICELKKGASQGDMDMPFGYPRISIPGPAH